MVIGKRRKLRPVICPERRPLYVSPVIRTSADRLKLKAGDAVVAIIKASEVLIAK
jgi:molybdopterin-binding protein